MSEYAPYPLTTDAREWGLVESRLTTSVGTTVVRHRPSRGSTRATVFLHGAAGSWTTWTPVLAAARERGLEIADLVLLDLAGWGDGALRRAAAPTIESVAETVVNALDELGYSDAHLVGHSMGGFIAMHVAAVDEARVRSVGLVSTTAWSVVEVVDHPLARLTRLPGFVGLWQAMRMLAALGPVGSALVRGLYRVGLLRVAVSPLFRHPRRVPRSVVRALRDEVRPRAFLTAVGMLPGFDIESAWRGIHCPIWAINGDRDVFSRPTDLERLRALLPQATTATVPDCGHFATVEHPDEIVDRLVREAGHA